MKIDLSTASRENLVARILELDATVVELHKRIDDLEKRLTKHGGPGMPGNKPTSTTTPPVKEARKKRSRGFGRTRMKPTEQVDHAVDNCPGCGAHLIGGWVQWTREVLEIPVLPVRVIEHRFIARECPKCSRRCVPKAADLDGVVGQERVGVNLTSLIVTLREEGRLPFARIQWYLKTVYQLHLSVGELVAIVQRTAERAKPAVERIRDQICASPVVNADETGWRENGKNGYVWTFSTPTLRYFLRRGRKKEVVDEVLAAFIGVLGSDFYAAYNHYLGPHQRCWAHLLREILALLELYPNNAGLRVWAEAVHKLYKEAKDFASPEERVRYGKWQEMEEQLLEVCRPFANDPLAVQARLCRRIHRFIKELFTFVEYPFVPSDNNTAERSLRHLVTSRKISGGTRGNRGTESKMTLSSLFGTWRAQGLNPFQECLQLLADSPNKSPAF